jgi:tetratricopeptide (TPR) repeat protein
MAVRDIFTINRGTKVVLLTTFLVSVIAVLTAFFYYGSINRSEDPRIRTARDMLVRYDALPYGYDLTGKLMLLDSAGSVFRSYPDYANSFETGVILNNKSSAFLVSALYDTSVTSSEKDILLELAMTYADSSITVYKKWLEEWRDIGREEVEARIRMGMLPADPAFKGRNYEKLITRRVKNQMTAQIETPRRLSVSLSNRGIIYRHIQKYDSAAGCFSEALSLWKNNRVARSNLNVLMGGDPVKPGIIESLFPSDRKKPEIHN